MGKSEVILRARQFFRSVGITSAPVDIDLLAAAVNAKITISTDLDDDESGYTFPLNNKHTIVINGKHREERRRFTALHEIAHIVLGIPSQHHGQGQASLPPDQRDRRPQEEALCDTFAAECLLPYDFFNQDASNATVSMATVKRFAEKYKASVLTTGSKFADNSNCPCAFVLCEGGHIRYASMSKSLREMRGWIELNQVTPNASVARLLAQDGLKTEGCGEVAITTWFTNPIEGFELVIEESLLLKEWDRCVSLLWLDTNRELTRTPCADDEESA